MEKLHELLTIVIPCKNENVGIYYTLNDLISRKELADVRIIVADSSTDEITKRYIRQFPNVELITGGYPSVARNNGASLVNTPYVLFLDADMQIVTPVEINPTYELITAIIRTNDKYNIVWKLFDLVRLLVKHQTPFAVGGYMLFKTDAFRRLGGFNPNDIFAEDYHLSSKIHPDKFYISSTKCITSSRRFKKKGLLYMVKMLLLSWRHRYDDAFFTKDHGYWS
jgi:glycosyltransferase involved in cell wall biosynthesis